MSISMWRLLSIIALILGLIILLIIKLLKPLNNKYNYGYRVDNLIKNEKKGLYTYNVYEVSSKSYKYIDKYIIKKNGKKKELIVDYVSKYKYISFFILVYSKKDKLLKIMKFGEHNNTLCSKPIKLIKRAEKINITVDNIDGVNQGITLKGKVNIADARAYAFFSSLSLFLILFAIRELLTEALCYNTLPMYLETKWNLLITIIIFILSFINMIRTMKMIKKEFDLVKREKKTRAEKKMDKRLLKMEKKNKKKRGAK